MNECTDELFRVAPTPQAMAALDSERDVLPIIKSVGLAPTKSRNLVAMAKKICADPAPAAADENDEEEEEDDDDDDNGADNGADGEGSLSSRKAPKKASAKCSGWGFSGFGGAVPREEAALVSLPGVGPKTAAVVSTVQ